MATAALDRLETSNYLTKDVTREDGVDSPERRAAREREVQKVGEGGRSEAMDTVIRDPNPQARFDAMQPEVSKDTHSSGMLKDFAVTDGEKVIADGSDVYAPRLAMGTGGTIDSADKLLAKNPELKLDPTTKAQLDKDVADLAPRVKQDLTDLRATDLAYREDNKTFRETLEKRGIKVDQPNLQEKLDELYKSDRKTYDKVMDAYNDAGNQKVSHNEIGKRIQQEEGDLYQKRAAANFEDNLSIIDKKYSPEQKAQIYSSLDSMMNNKQDSHPLSDADRKQYAQLLAQQLAHPEERICQGDKGTCQSADVQQMLLQKDPGFYAQQAASIITEGAILKRGVDGGTDSAPAKEVLLSPAQLKDDANPSRDPLSHAMQTAFADKTAKVFDSKAGYHYIDAKKGEAPLVNVGGREKPEYEQSKTGEYVTNAAGDNFPFLGGSDQQMTKVLSDLTGDKYESMQKTITSPAELQKALKEAGDKYPVMMSYQDEKESHVVAITGFDAKTGKYSIMNSQQFRSEAAETKTVDELYKSLSEKQDKYAKEHPQDKLTHGKLGMSFIYETN